MLQSDPFTLATRLAAFLTDALIFVGVALLIYLPGRYLLAPAVGRLLDLLDASERWQLPALKALHASVVLLAVFAGVNLSGLAGFLQTTEALIAGATIAIGFAAQDALGNIVSGVFIVLDPDVNIGDWIEWDGKEGIIEDISFRVTRVHTFDNELITVPNSELTKVAVTNPAAKDTRRITMPFCVAYDTDLERARELLVAAARDQEGVLDRPAPTVLLGSLDDACIRLDARLWVDDPARANFLRIRSRFTERVLADFEEHDIEMPYPITELRGEVGVERLERTP